MAKARQKALSAHRLKNAGKLFVAIQRNPKRGKTLRSQLRALGRGTKRWV
jgi:hypothetical protein